MKQKTSIIAWPFVQELFDQDGFRDNSALCSSDRFYDRYGDSSYAVGDDWLASLAIDTINRITSGVIEKGPRLDFATLPAYGDMLFI